jgi:hypothetical protein
MGSCDLTSRREIVHCGDVDQVTDGEKDAREGEGENAPGRKEMSPIAMLLRSFHGDKGDLLDCLIRAIDMAFPSQRSFRTQSHVRIGSNESVVAGQGMAGWMTTPRLCSGLRKESYRRAT